MRLQRKDVYFGQMQILVRDGKGGVRMLPQSVVEPLREHLVKVWVLHRQDIADGFGEVYLPYALDRKYPNAGWEWAWQHVSLHHAVDRSMLRRGAAPSRG